MERPASAGAGFAVAEPAWGAPVPALSFAEGLPKRLLEGLRIPEVILGLGLKMPLDACPELGRRARPVGWRACIELAG